MRMNSAARLSAACVFVVVFAAGAPGEAQRNPRIIGSKNRRARGAGDRGYIKHIARRTQFHWLSRIEQIRLEMKFSCDAPSVAECIGLLAPRSIDSP